MTSAEEAGLGGGVSRGFLAPYAEIFAIPRAWRFSVAGIIGRMPMSMYGLGTVLLISAGTGRYGLAGSVSATGSIGGALCAPQLGRLVDRLGQHRVLIPVGVTFALSVAGLALAVGLGAPDWTLFLCGITGGATMPQTGPMARARWSALLAGSPNVTVVQADLRRPAEILGHPGLNLDLSRPVALLLVAVLHYVPDEEGPDDILAEYREALAPGSHLVISHLTMEGVPKEHIRAGRDVLIDAFPIRPRSRDRVLGFFGGFDLIEPGLVRIAEWRPDHPRVPSSRGFAGVARKP